MGDQTYSDKDLYGSSGKPQSSDIAQGQLGDCYFISPLGAVANRQPEIIQNAISYDASKQSFTVSLYAPGQPKPVQIEVTQADIEGDKAVGVDGVDTPFHGKGPLWPEVMESAYAKMQAEHKPNETIRDELAHIGSGGYASKTIYALTGKADETVFADALKDQDKAYDRLSKAIAEGRPMLLNTSAMKDMPTDGLIKGEWNDDPSKRSGHAYMLEGVSKDKDGNVMVTVRNPWGHNKGPDQGVNSDDPTVTVKLQDILKSGHLQSIDVGPAAAKSLDHGKPAESEKPVDKPHAQTGDSWLDRMIASMNDPKGFGQALSEFHDSSYGQAFQAQGRAQYADMQAQQAPAQAPEQPAQPQVQQPGQQGPVLSR